MKRNQSGFTLIEIAIVLVIIGLLLGGVLKGQELINSAKVKNLANDFKNVPVFIYGYQDKFKALPGDQAQLNLDAQFPPANTATVCTPAAAGKCATNNGVIDGGWDATAVTDESYLFWQHVRLAGFGPGATATNAPDYRPKNAVNGFIGVTNAAQSPVTGIKGTYIVCSDGIPGKFAKQLDTTLDDSNTASGSVMVVAAGTPTTTPVAAIATTTIVDDTTYLVCMGY
ncbi:MAG: prepilin-type N-terminal cleavage/methylation domain-containing protein [Gallionella sp.]